MRRPGVAHGAGASPRGRDRPGLRPLRVDVPQSEPDRLLLRQRRRIPGAKSRPGKNKPQL